MQLVLPPNHLRHTISYLFIAERFHPPEVSAFRVLPTTDISIMFSLSEGAPSATLFGPSTTPYLVHYGSRKLQRTFHIGFAFQPGAAYSLLSCDIQQLRDQVLPVSHIWPTAVNDLLEQLSSEKRRSSRFAILTGWLEKLTESSGPPHRTLKKFLSELHASKGCLSVEEGARRAGISTRQLNRISVRWTGRRPQEIKRQLRYSYAAQTITTSSRPSFIDIALEHGYSDQAHFIHEFKTFTGVTPRQYFNTVSSDRAECPVFTIPGPGTLNYNGI